MKNQGPRVDFKAYKSGHFLRLVIAEFGLKSSRGTPLTHRGPCPMCCDGKPAARFFACEMSKGVWYCHKCRASGDALDLWARLAKVAVWQAALDLSAKDRTPVPYLPIDPAGPKTARANAVETKPGLALGYGSIADRSAEGKPERGIGRQGTLLELPKAG